MTGGRQPKSERRSKKEWVRHDAPSRILVMRFHAIGDVAVTLPFCTSLRSLYPLSRLDCMTTTQAVGLLDALSLFDTILLVTETRSRTERLLEATRRGSELRRAGYDLVIDLQRNWRSRLIRRLIRPAAWAEFDRFSPRPAADRVLSTFHEAGLTKVGPMFSMPIRRPLLEKAGRLLKENGWNGTSPLIVLNPAGLWTSRNWPLSSYGEFADRWSARQDSQFLLVGTGRIAHSARILKERLGTRGIDLSGRTSLAEALAVLHLTTCVLTEDSGLMHMAWASGVPTVALLGSSNHVWSSPVGDHCVTLHSGDLPCGACMSSVCRYADVHCLTRYTPTVVLESMLALLHRRTGRRIP